jgi:lipid-A-disaccharide synthase
VGIDAPDFNLRIERFARARNIPTLHYVCPSVWAWRQGRVKTLRAACDRVLCLLPFEAEFLEAHGVRGSFVGHPLADELHGQLSAASARTALGLSGEKIVSVLPGSRNGEVSRLAPVFARTAAWLADRDPAVQFAIPLASPAVADPVRAAFQADGPTGRWHCFDGRAREVIAAGDVVLVASGTATLETMLVNRPMVAAYRFAPLTYLLARALRLVRVEYFSLPNLLAGRLPGAGIPAGRSPPGGPRTGLAGLPGLPGTARRRDRRICGPGRDLAAQCQRSSRRNAAGDACKLLTFL